MRKPAYPNRLAAKKSTINSSWKETFSKVSTSPSAVACGRTGVRTQSQTCASCLVTRRLWECSTKKTNSVPGKGPTFVMLRYNAAVGEEISSKINIVSTEGSTPITWATPTTDTSAVMPIKPSPETIPTPASPRINGSSTTYVDLAPFCHLCLQKSHREAQHLLISDPPRHLFLAQRDYNLKNLRLRPQMKQRKFK